MRRRKLGATGPEVSALGLGAMGMSGIYGPADENESAATIHAALDAGIDLIDTGDFYGSGHNEMLIGRALRGVDRDSVVLSVKYGALRSPAGGFVGVDTRPEATKNFLTMSLARLGVDHVDVYRPARLDPATPIEETIGGLAELVEGGYVRHIGLSEVGPETIRRAAAVHPICDLQVEYSLMSREIEDEILDVCRELGIAITAYGVLSRGLLSGSFTSAQGTSSDFRSATPRFQGENLERNLELADRLAEIAAEHDASAAQVAIAWVESRGEDIIALVGTKNRERLADALGGDSLELSAQEMRRIEEAVPASAVAGERYPVEALPDLSS